MRTYCADAETWSISQLACPVTLGDLTKLSHILTCIEIFGPPSYTNAVSFLHCLIAPLLEDLVYLQRGSDDVNGLYRALAAFQTHSATALSSLTLDLVYLSSDFDTAI